MSNVTVTILQSGRCDDWGRPYVVGNSYSVEFNEAMGLWQTGFASIGGPTTFDDATPNTVTKLRPLPIIGFKRSLLASLVANSTASRTNGVVTVTATGHGIPTGSAYSGFTFFYPGSPNLLAGWYPSGFLVPTANTLTFLAPGPDFASESVNSAAAYTTATNLVPTIDVPAYLMAPEASARVSAQCSSTNTVATKTLRLFIGASAISPAASGTTFNCAVKEWGLNYMDNGQLVSSMVTQGNSGSGNITNTTFNPYIANSILVQLTVSAAADFLAVIGLSANAFTTK